MMVKLLKFLSWASLTGRRLLSAILLFLSIALAVVSVGAGFYMPTKLFGIPLAACGCFLSGWIFGLFLRRVVDLGTKDGDTRKKLNEFAADNDRLENECAKLRAEKKRLEGQRIDINVLSPIFKLGLVEADMIVKDVKIEWMNDFDKASWYDPISPDTRSRYVGILQKSFKTTYGIDLKKVLIREDPNCLRVAGVTPVLIGHKDDKTEWLLRQVQQYPLQVMDKEMIPEAPLPDKDYEKGFMKDNKYYGINTKKPFEGILDMNLICPQSERQEKELQDRINNGIDDFPFVNNYVREMAKGIIRIFLAPTEKRIEFVPISTAEVDGDSRWLGLEDFAKKYNERIDMKVPLLVESTAGVCESLSASQEVEENK